MLRAFELTPLMPPDHAAIYATGSDPITGASCALPLDQITHCLVVAKEKLSDVLNAASQDFLLETLDQNAGKTRLQRVNGLIWHEIYHLGQLEMLRQLAGTNDKII